MIGNYHCQHVLRKGLLERATLLDSMNEIWKYARACVGNSKNCEREVFMRDKFHAFFMFSALMLFFVAPIYAQDAKLIEAGKKEGKVAIYGSLESDTADGVFSVFRKKTGIDVDYWRASATKVMDRALSEHRAGRPSFDIIATNDNPMQIMFKEGIFAKYDSPSAKDFAKESIDPNLGPRYRNVVIGILYNKSVVGAAQAPKSLDDLVKPQYRGKLVMPD